MELVTTPTRQPSQILRQSLLGLRDWLLQQWESRVSDPALSVIFASTYAAEKSVALFTDKAENEPLAMPYMVLVPIQSAPSNDRYNAFALSKLGMRTGFIGGGQQERREKVRALDLGIGVKFVCNDVNEALMLAQIWNENCPSARFSVTQRSTGFSFGIYILPDENVDIPQADNNSGAQIEVTTTLILKTFAGTTEVNRLVSRVQHRFFDDLGATVDEAGDYAAPATPLFERTLDGYTVSAAAVASKLRRRP